MSYVNSPVREGKLPDGVHQSFRPDIQGLRAIAVILVILDHAQVPGFEGGYIGVDVFFVISGFVITNLLRRQPSDNVRHNLAYFYGRRIRRIVPAATLTLVATTFAAYFLLGANFVPQLLGDVRWSSLFSANFRLIRTGSNYFIPGVAPSLVTHFWSLAVEEQFYLFFPLVVFTLALLTPLRGRATTLGLFLVGAIAASAWYSWHLTPISPTVAYYSPFTRFWEIALGGLMALIPGAWARRAPLVSAGLTALAFVGLALAVWKLNAQSVYPGVLAWWPCGTDGTPPLGRTGERRGRTGLLAVVATASLHRRHLLLVVPMALRVAQPSLADGASADVDVGA